MSSNDLIPAFLNPLEDLLAHELAHQTPKRARNAFDPAKPSRVAVARFHEAYVNPENWTRTRAIALMHTETNTLLGNFSEFIHRDGRSRKWIRESEPCLVSGAEWVSGRQWVETVDDSLPAAERWEEIKHIIADLHIPEMGVRAFSVAVSVTLAHGGIRAVKLGADTLFASDDKRTVIQLPSGLGVLEALGFDCKLALRAEVGL